MKKSVWDGDANTANAKFGDRYGIDWSYVSADSSDITIGNRVIKLGDPI